MKLTVPRQDLADAVAWATRVAGARATLPALTGVLLSAADGRLVLRATDLEVTAEVGVDARIAEPGTVLLAARLLAQLVARLPAGDVTLADDGDRVRIECGRARFRVRRIPAEDFPMPPALGDGAIEGTVKAHAFSRLVTQVGRAAAAGEDARAVLTGVNLEAADGRLTAAATDTYRLAARSVAFERAVEGSAIVPARALAEVDRAIAAGGGDVTVVLDAGQAQFRVGDRTLTTRLVEGPFPNYRSLLPDASEVTVVVDRAALTEALQRAQVVASAAANTPVQLSFTEGGLELQVQNSEAGDATEQLAAEVTGGPLDIAFNPRYLADGLEAAGTERVRFELRDGLRAAVIRPEGEDVDDLTYLLMPMRVS